MIRGFRQIAFLTVISRIFGMIRDIAYVHFFGAGTLLDAWFIAFKVPNLSRRLFGEGAASASVIPVYSKELEDNPAGSRILANTVISVLAVILSAFVFAGWLIMFGYSAIFEVNSDTQLIFLLTSIMLPYMLMVCLAAVLGGILNVHRHFAVPALSPVILNIFIITTLFITGWIFKIEPRTQVYMVAFSVLAAGIAQIAMHLRPLRANGIELAFAWEVSSAGFKRIIYMMGPMIIGLTVTQLNTLTDDLIAWWLSASVEKGQVFELFGRMIEYPLNRGSVSYLNLAQRLYQMPLGVFGIALATAIFPVMSKNAAKKDYPELCRTIAKGIKGSIYIALPATAGLVLVAPVLISVAFQHGQFTLADAAATRWTLNFYLIGLTGFFIQQIIIRAHYSMHDSRSPARTAIIAVSLNLVLNLTLVWFLGTGGLALSTAICSYLQVVILTAALRIRLGNAIFEGIYPLLIKTIIATGLMYTAGWILLAVSDSMAVSRTLNLTRLIMVVAVTAGIYIGLSKLMKIEMLALLFRTKERHI